MERIALKMEAKNMGWEKYNNMVEKLAKNCEKHIFRYRKSCSFQRRHFYKNWMTINIFPSSLKMVKFTFISSQKPYKYKSVHAVNKSNHVNKH
jgi:hypothetical protein